jgi:ribosome biogenesis GTPase / thiamine phosphate phosphatase
VTDPADETLRALGWDEQFAAEAEKLAPTGAVAARVARVDRGVATVLGAHEPMRVTFDKRGPTGVIATGDWVLVADGAVLEVLPRRSAFVRGDGRERLATEAQVVAANIDRVFVVHALTNGPNLRRLERELVLAWQSGATPLVVLNKSDAVDEGAIDDAVAATRRVAADTPVVVTSAVDGAGIDDLRGYAPRGTTVALIGASGVGKSSLVNRLVGREVQATVAVREHDQRGRHATTARELVPLPGGGLLVDTPGLRAVSLWEADEGVELAFPDVARLAPGCRFRDCRHEHEPECAVRDAVDDGRLDRARLESYRRLQAELDDQDQRARARKRR